MVSYLFSLIILCSLLDPSPAQAQTEGNNLISFGLGYTNFDRAGARSRAGDFRLEYRMGYSLLPVFYNAFDVIDPYFRIHPTFGFETTTLGAAYGAGGLTMDLLIGNHFVTSLSEEAGLYGSGIGKPLGSIIEYRSVGEMGWRFSDERRLTAYISHISNDKTTRLNPGSETLGIYYHLPVTLF